MVSSCIHFCHERWDFILSYVWVVFRSVYKPRSLYPVISWWTAGLGLAKTRYGLKISSLQMCETQTRPKPKTFLSTWHGACHMGSFTPDHIWCEWCSEIQVRDKYCAKWTSGQMDKECVKSQWVSVWTWAQPPRHSIMLTQLFKKNENQASGLEAFLVPSILNMDM